MLDLSDICLLLSATYLAQSNILAVQRSNIPEEAAISGQYPDVIADPHASCIVGIYDPACWEVLDLTTWLKKWHLKLPVCPSGDFIDTSKCQVSNEPWTSTFLRFPLNNTGGSGCTELNSCLDNAPTSRDIAISDVVEAARYRYVCYNIYGRSLAKIRLILFISMLTYLLGINYFFSNWYQGMYDAAIEAGDLVNNIVHVLDPPSKNAKVAITDLLSVLSAGLVFLAIPEAAAISGAAAVIAPYFLKAIQQAPGVSKIIWPIGSVQRESIEIANLYNQLDTILEGLGPRIGDALAVVEGKNQRDVDNFLAFAETGEFSKPCDQQVDIANDTSGLLIGFTTYLVSEA